ncbi:hypothetical protein Dsin_027494 [Dipteronia sinensis]|uniref:Uncharacterized protein n=1 Tax=Dipteronia sinensis TaxID=43782 RepID=A0AAD9ZNM3_9ROSI|nr:hypothetical protein Dsin_027494 [Dipteronia sinensis]
MEENLFQAKVSAEKRLLRRLKQRYFSQEVSYLKRTATILLRKSHPQEKWPSWLDLLQQGKRKTQIPFNPSWRGTSKITLILIESVVGHMVYGGTGIGYIFNYIRAMNDHMAWGQNSNKPRI